MFIDSHCHLSDERLSSQLDTVLAQMKTAQVGAALCVSTTLPDYEAVKKIIEQHDHIWGSVGVHPSECEGVVAVSTQDLVERTTHKKIIAIGETGLDYHWHPKDGLLGIAWQQERFHIHMEAARITGLPLIIHTRDSVDDTLVMLKDAKNASGGITGVFHCFSESVDNARKALDLGFYLSFSGIVTFKNAKQVQEVAQFVPRELCLIETDSPYLTPTPFRGKLNTPAYVPYVAGALAHIWQVSVEEVAELTAHNFKRLFNKVA